MPAPFSFGILSDIHYAGAAEQARGEDYEIRDLPNPLVRWLLRLYRRRVWLRHPFQQDVLLDRFILQTRSQPWDLVIANGDFTCDTGSIGVSDPAACESVRECLSRLRAAFGSRFRAVCGDHELGKLPLLGHRGGMRLRSFHIIRDELGVEPFWTLEVGNYVLMAVTSSLVQLPVLQADVLPGERAAWEQMRNEHFGLIRERFASLRAEQRVLLFCHDPTALPFLWEIDAIQSRTRQIEQTLIGHLHSNLILWKTRLLAGMPRITFCGHSVKKFSTALREARRWREFKVRLCPALSGIELLNDGGYYSVRLDPAARTPAEFVFHRMPR